MRSLIAALAATLCLVAAAPAAASTIDGDDPARSLSQVNQTTYSNWAAMPVSSSWTTDVNNALAYWSARGRSACAGWAGYLVTINPTTVLGSATFGCPGNQQFNVDREFYNQNLTNRRSSDPNVARRAKRKRCAFVIHEVGHLTGITFAGQVHSSDPNNIMYPYLDVSNATQRPDVCDTQYP